MSAVLRADGAEFDVERFCAGSGLTPDRVYRRGVPDRPGGRVPERSGLSVLVSDAPFHDFPGQVREAVGFLSEHAGEVARLVAFPGVEGVYLDFGLAWREVAAQPDRLPPELVRAAGSLGLGIDLSHYPITDAPPET